MKNSETKLQKPRQFLPWPKNSMNRSVHRPRSAGFQHGAMVKQTSTSRAGGRRSAVAVNVGGSARHAPARSAEHKTGLLQTSFLANVSCMSAVELAVGKVKKLSARQARELLGWLTARQPNGTSLKQPARTSRRKTTARRSMQKLKAWQESVRGTTDWQPPRMPDDLVKPVRL